MNFKPDIRKTTYRLFTQEKKTAPNIIFSLTALKWIYALIKAHDTEVGFYAMIDEPEVNTYYVRDVFYPKHCAANGGTCEISPEGETEIMEYLVEKGLEEEICKIRFWGHYHPQGFTGPSGQDETQAFERMNSTQAYLIRAICTETEISVSFFDYNNQIRFDNIKWTVEQGASKSAIIQKLDMIKNLVTPDYSEDPHKIIAHACAILQEDQEMEQIELKIQLLKEKNIPIQKTYYRSGGETIHTQGGQQGNLFHHTNSTMNHYNIIDRIGKKTIDDDDDDDDFSNDNDKNSLLSEDEMVGLITDIDEQIVKFQNKKAVG